MPIARLASVALDCADPGPLARFWAEVLGAEIAFESPEFCAVKTGALFLAVVRVDDHRPPSWPESATPKQIHLDLAVDDLDAGEAGVLGLGAVKETEQPAPDRFRVYRDPAGHPFCLSTQIPD